MALPSLGGFAPITCSNRFGGFEEDSDDEGAGCVVEHGAEKRVIKKGLAAFAMAHAAKSDEGRAFIATMSPDSISLSAPSESTMGGFSIGSPATSACRALSRIDTSSAILGRASASASSGSIASVGEVVEEETGRGLPEYLSKALEAVEVDSRTRTRSRLAAAIKKISPEDDETRTLFGDALASLIARVRSPDGTFPFPVDPKEHKRVYVRGRSQSEKALYDIWRATTPSHASRMLSPLDLEHITKFQRNRMGKLTGYHFCPSPRGSESVIEPGSIRTNKASGVYLGEFRDPKSGQRKQSTFFPESFTTIEALLAAYARAEIIAETSERRLVAIPNGDKVVYAVAFSPDDHATARTMYPCLEMGEYQSGKDLLVTIESSRGPQVLRYFASTVESAVESAIADPRTHFLVSSSSGEEIIFAEISGYCSRKELQIPSIWVKVALKDLNGVRSARIRATLGLAAA